MEEKEVIAIYGGSFNPPLNSHFEIAYKILETFRNIKKIIFVPVNNKYKKQELIENAHRYNMLKLCCNKEKITVSDIELQNNKPSYTIETLKKIKNMNPKKEIWFVLGTDNLKELHNWYKVEDMLSEFKILVIPRNGDDIDKIILNNKILSKYKNVFVKLTGYTNILNSSYVREQIKQNKNFRQYMPEEVYEYIIHNNLY